MEAHPPKLIEKIVAALIPPSCREHVLGDLHERYTSAAQYIRDAVRTVPFVVASQIRRSFSITLFMNEAAALCIAFWLASSTDGAGYLYYERVLLPGLVLIAMTLGILCVLDAYVLPSDANPRHIFFKTLLAAACVYLIGFLPRKIGFGFAPERWLLAGFATTSVVNLYVALMWFAKYSGGPAMRVAGPAFSLEELRRRSQQEHRKAWLLNFGWIAAALLLSMINDAGPLRRGDLVGVLVVILFLALPSKQGKVGKEFRQLASSMIAHDPYRLSLIGKREGLRLWSFGVPAWLLIVIEFPFFILLLRLLFSEPLREGLTKPAWIALPAFASLLLGWLYLAKVNDRAAHAIQNEINALDASNTEE